MSELAAVRSVAPSILALQAAQALLTAGVFWAFQRRFASPVLAYWTWGWLALAAQLGGLASLGTLATQVPTTSARYTLLVVLTLTAGYLKVAWLVLGAFGIAMRREMSRSLMRGVVIASVLVAAACTIPFASGASAAARYVVRMGTMGILTGVTQLVAGIALWVRTTGARGQLDRNGSPHGAPALGQRLVATAFVAIGGLTLVNLANGLAHLPSVDLPPMVPAMTEVQLLINFTLGMGLVIWLLEGEQRRTLDAAQRAEHMAYHDPLTGLPNRLLLIDRLRLLVAHARRTRQPFAVFFLDVDHFKTINDTLGHAAGDRLLQHIAARLTAQLREADTVARLGGDEFVILTPDLRDGTDVTAVAEKLREAIRAPVLIDDQEVRVTASIGVSIFPDAGDDADALLRRSDGALYQAKAEGRDAVRLA
jgi:diguanylate cyclase (GGDEF)-like protein